MPTYEMPLLIRTLTRPELVTALKRAAGVIFDQGGIIRKIENLGARDLPFRITAHGANHNRANRFIFQFVVPPPSVKIIRDELRRDVDVVRTRIFDLSEKPIPECTLHEELLPPAYRKDVQEMISLANRKYKPKFVSNTGLNYYPFQK